MHSGMLNVSGEKMSKSLGNFQTLGDAMDRYGADLTLAMLQAHYRSLWNCPKKPWLEHQEELKE